MDEAQRCRIDAVAQPATIGRTIGKDVAEMAVAVDRTYLGADHAVRGVTQFVDVGRFKRPGETRPAASRIELVGRGIHFRTRSEEHPSELKTLMRISYAASCLNKKNNQQI